MAKKASKATKHRSAYYTPKGTKRYLKRNAKGQITDNQSYQRASRADQKKRSRAEGSKA